MSFVVGNKNEANQTQICCSGILTYWVSLAVYVAEQNEPCFCWRSLCSFPWCWNQDEIHLVRFARNWINWKYLIYNVPIRCNLRLNGFIEQPNRSKFLIPNYIFPISLPISSMNTCFSHASFTRSIICFVSDGLNIASMPQYAGETGESSSWTCPGKPLQVSWFNVASVTDVMSRSEWV